MYDDDKILTNMISSYLPKYKDMINANDDDIVNFVLRVPSLPRPEHSTFSISVSPSLLQLRRVLYRMPHKSQVFIVG